MTRSERRASEGGIAVDNGKISGHQLMILTMLFTMGSSILVVPSGLASSVQQDAWVPVAAGIVITLALSWFYLYIGSLYPDRTLVEIIEKLFGRWVGGPITLLFIVLSFCVGTAGSLYYLGDFMTTQIMPETPIQYFHLLYILLLIQGTRLGLETLARSAEILFPFFLLLVLAFMIFVSPQIETDRLQPMLEAEIKPILQSTLSYVSFSGFPLIFMLMLTPACTDRGKKLQKKFLLGNLIGGLLILITTILCVLVLGVDATSRSMYPNYALARKINLFNFINRIEVIMAIIWFISLFFKIAVYFYASVLAMAQLLRIENHQVLTFPLGMMLYVLSLMVYPDSSFMRHWDSTIWVPLIATFGLVFPLLFVAVAFGKRLLTR